MIYHQIKHVDCHRNSQISIFNINLCVNKKLSNKGKVQYIKKIWIPEKTFVFPATEFKNNKK